LINILRAPFEIQIERVIQCWLKISQKLREKSFLFLHIYHVISNEVDFAEGIWVRCSESSQGLDFGGPFGGFDIAVSLGLDFAEELVHVMSDLGRR
jgi:hypothetical protein